MPSKTETQAPTPWSAQEIWKARLRNPLRGADQARAQFALFRAASPPPQRRSHTRELADSLDDRDRLRARGYVWKSCGHCHGAGETCIPCSGKGGHWAAPLIG